MKQLVAERPWLPYVAPLALYMVFLQAEGSWPQWLALWYPLKTISVAALLLVFRSQYREIVPGFSWRALAVGVAVIVVWIVIDPFYPTQGQLFAALEDWGRRLLGMAAIAREPVVPYDPSGNWVFIAFRIAGAVLVVPVMEELFWRSFLIRWLVREDFQSVPLGQFTWFSFAATTVLFALAHGQWLAALIGGALYNALLYWRRDLFACILAHAVSNAILAGYVLYTQQWRFW